MWRFVLSLFVVLLLCQDVSARQDQTNTADKANASTPVPEQQESAGKAPEPHKKQTTVENEDGIGNQGSLMVERISELAKKTNFTLTVSIIATGIAFASWLAGRDAVKVTKEIGQKQTRAYLSLYDAKFIIDEYGWPKLHVNVKNTGNSPAKSIGIKDVAYVIDLGIWTDEEGVPKETRKSFSDAVTPDYNFIVPDIMSGETVFSTNVSIINEYDLSIIRSANAFYDSGKIGIVSVEVVCNLEYKDVFGEIMTVPCRFFATPDNRKIDKVPLDFLSSESASKIKELSQAYKDNGYHKRIVAAGLRPS